VRPATNPGRLKRPARVATPARAGTPSENPVMPNSLARVLVAFSCAVALPSARAEGAPSTDLGVLHADAIRRMVKANPPPRPVVVVVFAGSQADKAGLKRGDVLLEVAGRDIVTEAALTAALTGRRSGERVAVLVQRGGKKVKLAVVLRPALTPAEQVR